uniref:Core shell protein Gag P30 domain-containing protein n=1 Tax=Strigops habroptila TaxID=2489341 RepID=A0A672THS1_STRHB
MGNQQSDEILKKSPLGCILAHWKELGGFPGGSVNKKTLVKYCNQWWPLYTLEDQEKRPKNGTLNYNTLLQLIFGKGQEKKKGGGGTRPKQKTPHKTKPTKQKKPQQKSKLERCCSGCDIREMCLKLRKKEEDDRVEDYVSPRPPRGASPAPNPSDTDEEEGVAVADNRTGGSENVTPIAARIRSKTGPVTQAPLRQAMGPEGRTRIKVNFSMGDLDAWKLAVKDYRDDPIGVAKRFELIVKSQDPDWGDIDVMLDALTETEKQLVLKTACTHVSAQITAGALAGRVEDHIPTTTPDWDYDEPADYATLKRYQNWIKFGLENAIPKTVNWSALFVIKQGQAETPMEFLNRLREAMRKFTTLDPSSEEGKHQIANLFLGQSSEDIRKKLQKFKEPDNHDIEKLIEEAWRVYRNREQVAKKKQGRGIATATEAALGQVEIGRGTNMRGRGRGRRGMSGRGGGVNSSPLGPVQRAYCREIGHWKRDCPKLKNVQVAPVTELELD